MSHLHNRHDRKLHFGNGLRRQHTPKRPNRDPQCRKSRPQPPHQSQSPLTFLPSDMHSSSLLRHNLHPLLRLPPPLPHLDRPRQPPPHSRDRCSRNNRQASLIPQLRSPIQLRWQHNRLRRLRWTEYGCSRLLCLGRREQHDLL